MCLGLVHGDFIYVDFNATDGLSMFGSAIMSSCEEEQPEGSQPGYGYVDGFGTRLDIPVIKTLHEGTDGVEEYVMTTETDSYSQFATDTESVIGHRNYDFFGGYRPSNVADCPVRVKLTQSQPFQVGSLWRDEETHFIQGFSTEFSFQISDLSRSCTTVRDAAFSSKMYQSCSVHGGDGFVFVLTDDKTLPENADGASLGIAGKTNILAIEFDTWYNADQGDLIEDHITVLSKGTEETSTGKDVSINQIIRNTTDSCVVELACTCCLPVG